MIAIIEVALPDCNRDGTGRHAHGIGSGGGVCQDVLNVFQQAADLLDGVLSIYIAFEIGKGIVAKRYGEVGEIEQSRKGRGDLLTRIFQ